MLAFLGFCAICCGVMFGMVWTAKQGLGWALLALILGPVVGLVALLAFAGAVT